LEESEYAFEDVVFIDICNTKTSVISQKKWVIEGFNKIDIGINDLIKIIKENSPQSKLEIIKNIDNTELFLKEKEEFLSVWSEWLIITLKDILKKTYCPNKIFLSGWGDNTFIREKILSLPLQESGIITQKAISFIPHETYKNIKTPFPEIFEKQNLWLLSMILATKEIVNYKNNPVLNILREFLDKNEF
jgi:hypothetical protein